MRGIKAIEAYLDVLSEGEGHVSAQVQGLVLEAFQNLNMGELAQDLERLIRITLKRASVESILGEIRESRPGIEGDLKLYKKKYRELLEQHKEEIMQRVNNFEELSEPELRHVSDFLYGVHHIAVNASVTESLLRMIQWILSDNPVGGEENAT